MSGDKYIAGQVCINGKTSKILNSTGRTCEEQTHILLWTIQWFLQHVEMHVVLRGQ